MLVKLELLSAIASNNSYASLVFSKLPACIHNSIDARWIMNQFLIIWLEFSGTPIKNTRRGNQKMVYETPCLLFVFTNSENVSFWIFFTVPNLHNWLSEH